MVTAIVFIRTGIDSVNEVAEAVAGIAGVSEVYSVTGDLDLVAWQGPLLCIVEVKTRTMHDAAPAEVAVDAHKRKMLRRLARQYVRQLPQKTAPQVRFDVIGVYLVPGQEKEFVHFEAAFGWNEQPESY